MESSRPYLLLFASPKGMLSPPLLESQIHLGGSSFLSWLLRSSLLMTWVMSTVLAASRALASSSSCLRMTGLGLERKWRRMNGRLELKGKTDWLMENHTACSLTPLHLVGVGTRRPLSGFVPSFPKWTSKKVLSDMLNFSSFLPPWRMGPEWVQLPSGTWETFGWWTRQTSFLQCLEISLLSWYPVRFSWK
jgi:hypothetical protein